MDIIQYQDIVNIISKISIDELIKSQEEGFIAYSQKKMFVPPVGYLGIDEYKGDVHIKYGYLLGDKYIIIKIVSGFYENQSKYNIPNNDGTIIILSLNTGVFLGTLIDKGYLTEIRTAIAGSIIAKYCAPSEIDKIGIIGTGVQARYQLRYLKGIIKTKNVLVWGRNKKNMEQYKQDMEKEGFDITITQDIKHITMNCNYIVTTTPSTNFILSVEDIRPGTHITGIGADAKNKQEIDPRLFAKAKIIIADSIQQCCDHGDISYAIERKYIKEENIYELGNFIKNPVKRNPEDITIADLTGVACQDIQISKLIYEIYKK